MAVPYRRQGPLAKPPGGQVPIPLSNGWDSTIFFSSLMRTLFKSLFPRDLPFSLFQSHRVLCRPIRHHHSPLRPCGFSDSLEQLQSATNTSGYSYLESLRMPLSFLFQVYGLAAQLRMVYMRRVSLAHPYFVILNTSTTSEQKLCSPSVT